MIYHFIFFILYLVLFQWLCVLEASGRSWYDEVVVDDSLEAWFFSPFYFHVFNLLHQKNITKLHFHFREVFISLWLAVKLDEALSFGRSLILMRKVLNKKTPAAVPSFGPSFPHSHHQLNFFARKIKSIGRKSVSWIWLYSSMFSKVNFHLR